MWTPAMSVCTHSGESCISRLSVSAEPQRSCSSRRRRLQRDVSGRSSNLSAGGINPAAWRLAAAVEETPRSRRNPFRLQWNSAACRIGRRPRIERRNVHMRSQTR